MSQPALRIDAIPVRELESFAARVVDGEGVRPITPRRARSHSANPNANPEEVGLLVAYEGDRCVGFLGIMAGVLRVGRAAHRMHWFSSWYVDPDHAKSGAGTMLLMRAIGLKYDLAVTGTSPEADEMYRAMRFKAIGPLQYEEVFLDALDPFGFPFFAVGKWLEKRGKSAGILFKIADLLRPIAQPLLKRIAYAVIRPVWPSGAIAHVAASFENSPHPGSEPRFDRDADTVNWMLLHPWFTEEKADAVDGYYFGDFRPVFRYLVYRFERDGKSVGNAVFSVSRKADRTTVKVLDYVLSSDEDRSAAVAQAFEVASRFNADRILFPAEFKTNLRRVTLFGRLTFTRTRPYFCRPKKKDSVLTPVLDDVQLQLTDGDCAFS